MAILSYTSVLYPTKLIVTMPSLRIILGLLLFAIGVFPKTLSDYPRKDVDSGKVLKDLSKKAFDNAWKRLEKTGTPECNVKNVKIFKEWQAPTWSHVRHASSNLGLTFDA